MFILNLFLFILIFFFKGSDSSEPIDRWLVELKSRNDQCLDDWWRQHCFDKQQYLKKNLPVENWIVVEIPRKYFEFLRKLPCVKSISIDLILEAHGNIPNDPYFPNQANMNLIGMQEAWDVSTGGLTQRGDTIVVAVIDDGIQTNHEDLKNVLWHNYNELPNDGIDNDNNGYVDDYLGFNVTSGDGNLPSGHHGTCVSGIIGAEGNNEMGICGTNWNVKLMMIHYDFHISELVEAYQYIIDMRKRYNETNGMEGAFIVAVNLSSGAPFQFEEDYPIWCSMYDKLGEVGVLPVCTVANISQSVDIIGDLPALCSSPYTIIVTNVNPEDEIMDNAGYGRISVDIGAPGENVLTTDTSNTYNIFQGTSAAAPHVAGAVALLYSIACPAFLDSMDTNPSAATFKMKNIILSSGTPNKSLEGYTLSGKRLQIDAAMRILLDQCQGNVQNETQIRFLAPNPVTTGKTKLFFEITEWNSQIYYDIYSVTGSKIQSELISIEEYNQGYIDINTKSLAFGLYFIVLKNFDQIDVAKLVVK